MNAHLWWQSFQGQHCFLSFLNQLPYSKPGPWQFPLNLLMLNLRAVPSCVCMVPSGCTDGASVVPENRAHDFPVVCLQLVGPVHPCRFPILPAEATKVWWSPAAVGVQQAADRRLCRAVAVLPLSGLDVAPGTCCCCPGTHASLIALLPVTQPLQQCAQVHVVMPHIKPIAIREEKALDIDVSLHSCQFWKKYCTYVCWSLSYL